MTFSFQVLCATLENFALDYVSRALPLSLSSKPNSYNRLNSYLLVVKPFLPSTFFSCSALKCPKWWNASLSWYESWYASLSLCSIREVLYFIFFTRMYAKRLLNMCAKFSKNVLTGFWFMGFVSNWRNPGQSMHKQLESNRILKLCDAKKILNCQVLRK